MKTAETIEAAKLAKSNPDKTGGNEPQNTLATEKAPSPADRIAPWRWKKGFCPNPGGRPKKDRSQEIAREIFEQNPEAVYKALCKALLSGNSYAFQVLSDRAYGKLVQKQEMGSPGEFEATDESSINKRIAELLSDLGLANQIDEAGRTRGAKAGAGKTNGEAKIADVLSR